MEFINQTVIATLVWLYTHTGSLAGAIIIFTLLIRGAFYPLSARSLKAAQKMKEIQPDLKKIQKKYKNDKEKLQKKQLELYQKYNINPIAGCLPQLVQVVIFIALYRVFLQFVGEGGAASNFENIWFFGINLLQPDSTRILPIVAALSQLLLSIMVVPGGEVRDIEPNQAKSKAKQKANEKEEDMASMAASMQQQMMFILPFMTGFIALQFPAGLVLYWITATVFGVVQQWIVSGPGGLVTYPKRLYAFLRAQYK